MDGSWKNMIKWIAMKIDPINIHVKGSEMYYL